jgi:hypothetical protein
MRPFFPEARWHIPPYHSEDRGPAASIEEATGYVRKWLWARSRNLEAGVTVVAYSTGAQVLRCLLSYVSSNPVRIKRAVFWSGVPSTGVSLAGVARTTWAAPISLVRALLTGDCRLRSVDDILRVMYSGDETRRKDALEMMMRMHAERMYGLAGEVFLPGMRVSLPPVPGSIPIFAICPEPDVIVGGSLYEDENLALLTTPEFGSHALLRDVVEEGSDLEEIHMRAAEFLRAAPCGS